MNLNKSLITLNLHNKYNYKNIDDLTLIELRKAYHIQALNNHPDKNISKDSKEKFQNIQNAYTFLKNFINNDIYNIYENNNNVNNNNVNNNNVNNNNEDYIDKDTSPFINLIMNFLKLSFSYAENNDKNQKSLNKFQEECINYSNEVLNKLLNRLNLNILQELYVYIENSDMLNIEKKLGINSEMIEKLFELIKSILSEKMKNSNLYILKPSLENLLNNDIYKLEIDGEIIYVPLWHKELIYENNIIQIRPSLQVEQNITINEKNNIYYNYYTTFEILIELLRTHATMSLELELFDLKINLQEITLSKIQTFYFKNKGIPVINSIDIFDNSKKSTIILTLFIE